jgi:hypothetical protein
VNQNELGYFWYCYNDAEGRSVSVPGEEFSEIIEGAVVSTEMPTLPVIEIDGNGYDGGNGAWIKFQLGPTYAEGGETIKPFVGIGTKLTDDLVEYYNATDGGATGVYFDYQTSGDIDFIRFEVKAKQVFPNDGIVHHVLLPGTGGQWSGASIPFDKLKLPDWDIVNEMMPSQRELKLDSLDKLQWAFQGDAGSQGTMAVDNVKFIGAKAIRTVVPIRDCTFNGISVQHRNGQVIVHSAAHSGQSIQSVTLSTIQGSIVSSKTLATHNTTVSLPLGTAQNIAAGMYILGIVTERHQRIKLPLSVIY